MKQFSQQKICESCETNPATLYCIQCSGYLCAQCESQIHQNKLQKRHQRVLCSDSNVFEPVKCTEHGQHVQLLCADCQELICSDCYLEKHKGHAYQPISEAFDIVRQEFRVSEDVLYQKEAQISQLQQEIQKRQENLQNSFAEVKQRTQDNFAEVEQLLATKKQQILQQLDSQYQRFSSNVGQTAQNLQAITLQIQQAKNAIMQGKRASAGIDGTGEILLQKQAYAIELFLNNAEKIQSAIEPDSQLVQNIDNMMIDVEMEPQICLDVENVQKFIQSIEGLYLAIQDIGQK